MKFIQTLFLFLIVHLTYGISSKKKFVLYHSQMDSSPKILPHQNISFSYFITASNQTIDENTISLSFYSETSGVVALFNSNITVEEPTRLHRVNFTLVAGALSPGHAIINVSSLNPNIDLRLASVGVKVMKSEALDVLSTVIGWGYFFAWSISFYPQIYENWRRKSVIGLNFDFLFLNIVGFALYSFFNIGLYWITTIQEEYFLQHPNGVNPVKLNDVIFSLHATCVCLFTIYQCYIYERGNQTVSKVCRFILLGIFSVIVVCTLLSFLKTMTWLDFLYVCSYCKLGITLIKFIPQAYMNYQRKSTLGWSIGNVLLDFTGGVLSIGQMLIDAYNFSDWGSIIGDPTKMGLGLFSISFDLLFIVQHYVLYRNRWPNGEDNERIIDNDEENPHDD